MSGCLATPYIPSGRHSRRHGSNLDLRVYLNKEDGKDSNKFRFFCSYLLGSQSLERPACVAVIGSQSLECPACVAVIGSQSLECPACVAVIGSQALPTRGEKPIIIVAGSNSVLDYSF